MSQPPPPPPPPPSGPQGQDPYASQPGYSQPVQPGYPGYAPAYSQRKPLDMAKLVTIAAWVVLGLYGIAYFYLLTQSERDTGMDFGDRFFGGMPELGTGILYTGILLAVGKWLEKQQSGA